MSKSGSAVPLVPGLYERRPSSGRCPPRKEAVAAAAAAMPVSLLSSPHYTMYQPPVFTMSPVLSAGPRQPQPSPSSPDYTMYPTPLLLPCALSSPQIPGNSTPAWRASMRSALEGALQNLDTPEVRHRQETGRSQATATLLGEPAPLKGGLQSLDTPQSSTLKGGLQGKTLTL
eukprot:scaffold127320_cov20-Tisochrysis_lutea.AAC.4